MVNPFHAKGPVDPKYFADREELLDFFRTNVLEAAKSSTKPDNIAILGNWGTGKSSALMKFQDILQNEMRDSVRSLSCIFPLKPSCCVNSDMFATTFLDDLKREHSASTSIKSKVSGIIREESKLWKKWRIDKVSLAGPSLKRKEESVSMINLSSVLQELWKKLKSKGVEIVVIMIDDLHYLLTEGWHGSLYDIRTDIQNLSSKGCSYMFVVAGAKSMYPEMQEVAEPFTRLFEKFDLRPFSKEETKELIQKPLQIEKLPIELTDGVIRAIHDMAEGHPYFINIVMRDLVFSVKKGKITKTEFASLLPKIMSRINKHFEDNFSRAADKEQDLLTKASFLDKKIFSPSDIRMKAKGKIIERLCEKELLTKVARGKYKFYHPLFYKYVKSLKPL